MGYSRDIKVGLKGKGLLLSTIETIEDGQTNRQRERKKKKKEAKKNALYGKTSTQILLKSPSLSSGQPAAPSTDQLFPNPQLLRVLPKQCGHLPSFLTSNLSYTGP